MKRYLRIDGRRVVAYDVIGDGPMLVCVPGGPGYGGDQLSQLGGLTATRTLVRLDLRGAGESDPPPPPSPSWSFEDYAVDLELVRQDLKLDRMDLFGHAHGGLSVATYARWFPDRVGHVVLDGLPVRPVPEFDQWEQSDVSDYFEVYDGRANQYMAKHMGQIFEPAMAWFWDYESKVDFRALVRGVEVPTLLVSGEHDPMAGRAAVESLVREMARASALIVPTAGHFAWVEHAETYAAEVEDFLRHPVSV